MYVKWITHNMKCQGITKIFFIQSHTSCNVRKGKRAPIFSQGHLHSPWRSILKLRFPRIDLNFPIWYSMLYVFGSKVHTFQADFIYFLPWSGGRSLFIYKTDKGYIYFSKTLYSTIHMPYSLVFCMTKRYWTHSWTGRHKPVYEWRQAVACKYDRPKGAVKKGCKAARSMQRKLHSEVRRVAIHLPLKAGAHG